MIDGATPAHLEPTVGSVASPRVYGDFPERPPGSMVGDDYRIEGRLGAGAMGVVYAATHTKLDRRVALKELRATPDNAERLLREAMAMARVDHPNVVRVFDARLVDGVPFIAMELVEGATLRQWGQAGRRTCAQILAMFTSAGRGVAAAHAQGLVHRDFKPDNVLVTGSGVAKVADFGIARAPDITLTDAYPDLPPVELGSGLTRTGELLGTPAYMAPEQFEGHADARADQFAFCVALFEALYGVRPFAGETLAQLWTQIQQGNLRPPPPGTDVPPPVREVLRRGLRADPSARHRDMSALVTALELASRRRVPVLPAIALAVVGVGAIAGGLVWYLQTPAVPSRSGTDQPKPPQITEIAPEPEPLPEPESKKVVAAVPAPTLEADDEPPVDDETPVDDDGTASKTVWPGGGSIVCANQNAWYAGITADSGDEPLIVARDGCDFRCSGCTLRGNPVIAASGDAKVTLAGTSLTATGVVALVHGDSTVAIGQDSEIDATQTALGFSVRGDATLKLVGISFASEIGLSARDRASVFLTRTSITGSKTSVLTGEETTLVEDDVSYAGLTKIRGQRVKDSTGGKTRD